MQAWQVYLEEFRRRAADADAQRFGRHELLTEAAHDAYQAAADRLTREHGWDDEHTLVVMRGLNEAVRNWLDLGGAGWDELTAELQRREDEIVFGTGAGGAGKSGNMVPRE
jgi:hypothetical protein